jgi:pimeloyl-ACP methyl ester carboxylesterase
MSGEQRDRTRGRRIAARTAVTLATLAGGVLGAPMLLPEATPADRLPRRELARPTSRFVRLDGLEVHHEVHGPGAAGPSASEAPASQAPTLLLSHHFYGSTPVWDRLVPLLADEHRVVTWDRPGFGLTERPLREARRDNPYTRAAAARLGWSLLDMLGVDEAVLVGASAGGSNVLEMYAQAPDRVRALVLLAPAITGDVGAPPQLRPLLNTAPLRRIAPRVVERFVGEVTRERSTRSWADPSRAEDVDLAPYRDLVRVEGWSRGLWEVMTAEPPPDLRRVLRSIRVPTLVVTGAQDRTISPRWGRWVAATVPGGRFTLLPDCGHVPHQERPSELATIMRPFLAEALGHTRADA